MAIDTTGTDALLVSLRAYLLDYVPRAPLTGGTLRTLVDERLHQVDPPDTLTYPFFLMRLMGMGRSGAYNGDRQTPELELMGYARPRSQRRALHQAADVIDQAMTRYVDRDALGLVFSRQGRRDDIPAGTNPADASVIQVRLVFPLVVWPAWLYDGT